LSVFSASSIRLLSWEDLLGLQFAHLVPANAPLPEEAIFNQNQAAVERRRVARMAQHKKRLIAKRDRNDGRNKRHKVGEQGIFLRRGSVARAIVER
jgi:hypothetical protein